MRLIRLGNRISLKNILITGATGGIGNELVKKFDLGAGQWGDNILSNLSQPNSDEVDTESTTDDVMIERLKKEMKQAAERLEFEKAAQLRDRILQLENSKSN